MKVFVLTKYWPSGPDSELEIFSSRQKAREIMITRATELAWPANPAEIEQDSAICPFRCSFGIREFDVDVDNTHQAVSD